jgi:hypothetical protein
MEEMPPPLAPRPEELMEAGEELLLKARAIARQIEERVWQTMGREPVQPSGHGPGVQHESLAAVND